MGAATRRGFLLSAGAGMLALGRLQDLARAQAPPVLATDVRATLAAFADTIVPGPAGGADDAPGAVEAGAVAELFDPFYGIADALPGLAADLQLASRRIAGADFTLALPYAARELVVRDRMTEPPAGGSNPYAVGHQALAVLVYLTAYGTAQSDTVLRAIGFPPESDGYFPRHGHGVRFRRMTRYGNPS